MSNEFFQLECDIVDLIVYAQRRTKSWENDIQCPRNLNPLVWSEVMSCIDYINDAVHHLQKAQTSFPRARFRALTYAWNNMLQFREREMWLDIADILTAPTFDLCDYP